MLSAASLVAAPAWARGPDPRRMHDWMGWRWDGRWFGPLCMIALLAALQIAGTVALVRWIGGNRRNGTARRTWRGDRGW